MKIKFPLLLLLLLKIIIVIIKFYYNYYYSYLRVDIVKYFFPNVKGVDAVKIYAKRLLKENRIRIVVLTMKVIPMHVVQQFLLTRAQCLILKL